MWEKLLNLINALRPNPAPVVAVLRLSGVIAAGAKARRSINLENTEDLIAKAFSLSNVKAVALIINSPGGSPVQSAMITDRIRSLAKDKDIPVIAFCEDVAASGGYMLALAGDEIYAHETSIVGSIGVIYAGFGFVETIKKLGIDRRVYTAGEKKFMLDSFSKEKEEDIEKIKGLQKNIHESFKAMVRDRRGKRLKGPRGEIFSGDVWTGKDAEKHGLIDGLGEMRTFMKDRFGDRVRFRHIKMKRPTLGSLLDLRHSSKVGTNLLPQSWADDVLETVETRSFWDRWGL